MVNTDYVSVTEIAGDDVSQEQIDRLCNRYYWAGQYCTDKDVVEVACGTGQGLGYLQSIARSLVAGDYSKNILSIAHRHYGDRIVFLQFDGQNMPFDDQSKDVILLFEAIYYLPSAEKFIRECVRILKPGGKLLIATANKDLYDFNPSPHSFTYYGVKELNTLFSKFGLKVSFYGNTPVADVSLRQKILRPIKKLVVMSGLMPKSMAGKKILKKIIFGNMVTMPTEIGPPIIPDIEDSDSTVLTKITQNKNDEKTLFRTIYSKPEKISSDEPNTKYKVIYCVATIGDNR